MRIKRGTKVRVNSNHPHHANREGVFSFFNATKDTAIVQVDKRGACEVLVAIKPDDLQICDSHNREVLL